MDRNPWRPPHGTARAPREAGEGGVKELIYVLAALVTIFLFLIQMGWVPAPPRPHLPRPSSPPPAVVRPVSALPGGGAGVEQELLDVAVGPQATVATGWTKYPESGTDPAVWVRRGEAWHDVAGTAEVFARRGGDQELKSVAASQDGFVAVGEDDGRAAVFGADRTGRHWARQPLTTAMRSDSQTQLMHGVAAHKTTLVAVGAVGSGSGQRAAAWLSAAGQPWRPAPLDQSPAELGGPSQILSDVLYTGSRFVAVGQAVAGSGSSLHEPAVWTSTDGARWTRLASQAITDPTCDGRACRTDQVMYGIVAFGNRLMAVGTAGPTATSGECGRSGAVWLSTSSSGSSWRRVALPKALQGGSIRLYAAAASTTHVIAVGDRQCEPVGATAWISARGNEWFALPVGGSARGENASMASVGLDGADLDGIIVGSDLPSTTALAWRIQPR